MCPARRNSIPGSKQKQQRTGPTDTTRQQSDDGDVSTPPLQHADAEPYCTDAGSEIEQTVGPTEPQDDAHRHSHETDTQPTKHDDDAANHAEHEPNP